jgi:hypothetical protein
MIPGLGKVINAARGSILRIERTSIVAARGRGRSASTESVPKFVRAIVRIVIGRPTALVLITLLVWLLMQPPPCGLLDFPVVFGRHPLSGALSACASARLSPALPSEPGRNRRSRPQFHNSHAERNLIMVDRVKCLHRMPGLYGRYSIVQARPVVSLRLTI